MLIDSLIFKLTIFAMVFAILFIVREAFMFYKALRTGERNMTTPRLWGLGISLSFLITIIFTGLRF